MSSPCAKWKYHREKPACIVQNNEEEAALGPGWWDSPADVNQPWPEPAPAAVAPDPAPAESAPDAPSEDAPVDAPAADPSPDPAPTLEPDPAPRRRRR